MEMRTDQLCLRWRPHPGHPESSCAQIVINGVPFEEMIGRVSGIHGGSICPIGWTKADYESDYIAQLLAERPAALQSGRCEILVCPECADIGCGCVSAEISQRGESVIWSAIGYENNYNPQATTIFPMGALKFGVTELAQALRSGRR
ncbi:MAG TPA: hypothetical protein VFE47_05815 [Tepidisphaeraceae bacterium]|jgi:hypothetical protein|nr:hypothetical protein [Tepidisphaeraceae bacterium]